MRKLFLHLIVSCTTFFFGMGLSKLWNIASMTAAPATKIEEQIAKPADLTVTEDQQLLEIYREYAPAQTRHDRAFFERVESEDFILFRGDRNLTREEDIRDMESWPKDIVYDHTVENVRILGDAAVVTGRMRAHYPNGAVSSWGFIDICTRNGDSWQILSTTSVK